MNPDYKRHYWWAAADNYLGLASFHFERSPGSNYVWYLLLGWAECMEELKEMIDAD
jgi:hypothetical protein